MEYRIDLIKLHSAENLREKIFGALENYRDLMPESKRAKILLKPNLNANMNALTGNTTDLRLLALVVQYLKDNGYDNITIGEGTNSGYYRNNISVISRLKVDKLAEYFGVKVVDLNYSEIVHVDFENGVKAGVAKESQEADLLINMPKLKTHFEMGMSVCLKNMMGCLVGQENKKRTHKSLANNILNINKHVKPHLHIIDALIAMEGLGPTRGTPVNTSLVIMGTDPFLLDLTCATIAGFDYQKVKTLKSAEEQGLLTGEHRKYVESLDLSGICRKFQEPKANFFASFIHSPKRQRYFLAVRNTALFNYLCSTKLVGKLLFWTGLRQDNFIKEDMVLNRLEFNKSRCKAGCVKCAEYCPIGLRLPEDLESRSKDCIGCLYCFLVCPSKAIEFHGELGFMAEQIKQYDDITRDIA